ncbi:YrdB family protein [Microbacterium sp. gxy059]|uniref:YrdB family protein n=1 Tax=Microbacterium sp. gxy059 TaxID=2957199 RepID=UPI003D99C38D
MPDSSAVSRPRVTVLDVLRLASELVAFASLALWGFLAWPMPWSVVAGIGAPVAAILLWALFVSPRAVVAVPLGVRTIVELLIFVSATLALWALDLPWAGVAVGAFCVLIGVLVLRRDLR